MTFVADLHLHSKYSRAVSQNMVLPEMARWASLKGLDIISASDFTHPLWLRELKSQLKEASEGLYILKSQITNDKSQSRALFLLSTEISSIYKQGEKLRRIHNLVFAPNFETTDKINKEFTKRAFNLIADGRPIIGLSSKDLLELLLSIDKNILLIPCHVWTPHFGVYGSKSGFDSLDEAFGDLASYVYGIETGISSDPEMNWRVLELKDRSILSFSDAHSPANMAREAVAFELAAPTYGNIRKAIMRKGGTKDRIAYTIEFYPEEGKYHYSGHRNCKISFAPSEIAQKGTICPVCRCEFTEGVALRIEQLAGAEFAKVYEEKESARGVKWYTDKSKNHPPYVKLVRLTQVIGGAMEVSDKSIKVQAMYDKVTHELGSEIEVLLKAPLSEIEKIGGPKLSQGLDRVRRGNIVIDPGYDGEYGRVKIWNSDSNIVETTEEKKESQMGLQF